MMRFQDGILLEVGNCSILNFEVNYITMTQWTWTNIVKFLDEKIKCKLQWYVAWQFEQP